MQNSTVSKTSNVWTTLVQWYRNAVNDIKRRWRNNNLYQLINSRFPSETHHYLCSLKEHDIITPLHNIIAPAAPMVHQQSALIITPEWEYILAITFHFPSILVLNVTTEVSSFK